jgi:Spy/CpxP family protein refolding chaperone
MKKHLIRFASVAALAAGMAIAQTAPPAQAQPPAAHHPIRRTMHLRMMQQLNLTPAQRDQAKAIFQQARQTTQPYTQQLRQNREAMAAAVKANDGAKIRQLAAERGRLMGQVMAVRSEATARFYSDLTPAQRTKADQIHQRIAHRIQSRRMQTRTNG